MFYLTMKKMAVVFFCLGLSVAANAATVDIARTGESELIQTIAGVWTNNQKISFSETGSYTMTLTDYLHGERLDYMGVMVSTSLHKIVDIVISSGDIARMSKTFELTQGEYWLSIFALTGDSNFGSFGVDFTAGDLAPVPLPSAFIFMATSLLGFASFVRQRKAARAAK